MGYASYDCSYHCQIFEVRGVPHLASVCTTKHCGYPPYFQGYLEHQPHSLEKYYGLLYNLFKVWHHLEYLLYYD